MTASAAAAAASARCYESLVLDYASCPGRYCGRLLLNATSCAYSTCQRCPRGSRPVRLHGLSVCEPCADESRLYDYLYVMFAFNLLVLFNLIFIDNAYQNISLKKLRSLWYKSAVVYSLPVIECALSLALCLLFYSDNYSLRLNRSCRSESFKDWYSLVFDPYVDYENKLHCAQEVVYPLYSIVLLFALVDIVAMTLARPLVIFLLYRNETTTTSAAATADVVLLRPAGERTPRPAAAAAEHATSFVECNTPMTSAAANAASELFEMTENHSSVFNSCGAHDEEGAYEEPDKLGGTGAGLRKNHFIAYLNRSTYEALYFSPILCVFYSVGAGIIYYSFPIVSVCVLLVTNTMYLSTSLRYSVPFPGFYLRTCFKRLAKLVTPRRNLCITLIHVYMYIMTLLSLREYVAMLRSTSSQVRPSRTESIVDLFGAMPGNWEPLPYEDDNSALPTSPPVPLIAAPFVVETNGTSSVDSASSTPGASVVAAAVLEYFLIIFVLPISPSIFFMITYKFTDPKRFMNFI